LLAGRIVFVALRFLVTLRKRRASGVLGLGLIPILAESVLATPIELVPTAELIVGGIPVAHAEGGPSGCGLAPHLLAALRWLHAHSSVDAVITVSNYWVDAADTDGHYHYYSAFSDRQPGQGRRR
jgi:hypothetical protein